MKAAVETIYGIFKMVRKHLLICYDYLSEDFCSKIAKIHYFSFHLDRILPPFTDNQTTNCAFDTS